MNNMINKIAILKSKKNWITYKKSFLKLIPLTKNFLLIDVNKTAFKYIDLKI